MLESIKKLFREPLLHFLLVGAGIYAVYGIVAAGDSPDDDRRVVVSAGDVQALTDNWIRLWGRPPTEQELAGALRQHLKTQILYREAVAMGLDQGDLVIERRLAQKVEMLAQGLSTPAEPGEDELRAWYLKTQEQFKEPDLYTINHVFFDPDKRDAKTLEDAQVALEALNSPSTAPQDFANYGDRFMLQSYYPERSEIELRKLFGAGFVDQVVKLEPGRWHGPILSGYGTHLVLVNDVAQSAQPTFESVRDRVRENWFAAKIEEQSERFLDNLIARYEIDVDSVEVPITVPGRATDQ